VLAAAEEMKPSAMVVDSIQTLHLPELGSAPGSVAQVRELTGVLLGFAKRTGIPTFLVGHVTKDGAIAGPKVLEHMVDTVLYFEGDRYHAYRILRAHKNRFGSVSEIGVFEMREEGLVEVADPSAVFLAERPDGAPGSVVTASLSGSRPVLVEIQVLVSQGVSGGSARRTTLGVDHARVALLAAVLEKRLGLTLFDQDLFVNVAGGLSLDEPAVDLAVAVAIASSLKGVPCDPGVLVLGEVGLTGEVRAVSQVELRLAEAAKMGFSCAVVPEGNRARLGKVPSILIRGAKTLEEAVEVALGG
jgi:DNA repair protein RadA/Sms